MNSQEGKRENAQEEMFNFMGDDTEPFSKQLPLYFSRGDENPFISSLLNMGSTSFDKLLNNLDDSIDQIVPEEPFDFQKTQEKYEQHEVGYENIFLEQNEEERQEGSQEEKKGSEIEQENSQEYLAKLTPKTEAQKMQENISQMSNLDLEQSERPEEKKRNKCNCKKSKCLKLYCECFRSGEICGKDCICIGCQNQTQESEKRKKAKQEIIEKDDNAFLEKVKYNGCRCTKNQCKKNYCECYRLGVGCGKYCQCLDCENSTGKKQRKRKNNKRKVKTHF